MPIFTFKIRIAAKLVAKTLGVLGLERGCGYPEAAIQLGDERLHSLPGTRYEPEPASRARWRPLSGQESNGKCCLRLTILREERRIAYDSVEASSQPFWQAERLLVVVENEVWAHYFETPVVFEQAQLRP